MGVSPNCAAACSMIAEINSGRSIINPRWSIFYLLCASNRRRQTLPLYAVASSHRERSSMLMPMMGIGEMTVGVLEDLVHMGVRVGLLAPIVARMGVLVVLVMNMRGI